jgi:hypothetical protein
VDEILTRCGYRCDLCLAYRPNVEANPSNREVLSDGWQTYFGFRIPPEDILCDGCMDEDPHLIDRSCPVRPCVIARRRNSAAACPEYGCTRLAERFVVYEDIAARIAGPVPEEDRRRVIAPYENRRRLDALRERDA